jgi:hypothetical protein
VSCHRCSPPLLLCILLRLGASWLERGYAAPRWMCTAHSGSGIRMSAASLYCAERKKKFCSGFSSRNFFLGFCVMCVFVMYSKLSPKSHVREVYGFMLRYAKTPPNALEPVLLPRRDLASLQLDQNIHIRDPLLVKPAVREPLRRLARPPPHRQHLRRRQRKRLVEPLGVFFFGGSVETYTSR